MSNKCEIVIWDVQHGHAAYIKSPNGRHIIVDVGLGSFEDKSNSFSPLHHLWKEYDVKQIDYAILTHPHKDHIEDIFNLEKLSPKVLSCPRHLKREDIITEKTQEADKPIFEKYLEIEAKLSHSLGENSPNDPSNPDNYGGLEMKGFISTTCATSNLNNHSCISVMSYAKSKIVFPGDNEQCSYEELLKNETFKSDIKDADILLAPHHGRESGYYKDFVELVNPRLTIISDSSKKDTNVVDDYGKKSKGWKVYSRSGKPSEDRKTLSTYNDGHITIHFGHNTAKGTVYMKVTKK
jgi:competence protein ComEC